MKLGLTLAAMIGFTLANFVMQDAAEALKQSFLQVWALGGVYVMHKFLA